MEYFAGIGASLRSRALRIVDGKGTMLLERELPSKVKDIAECLATFQHPIKRVGFEAGTMSQPLYFSLKTEGFDMVCMEAQKVNAALAAMRNKTDKNDTRGIAQVLLTGWFNPVHMKSREAHGVRASLSARKALLKKTMDLANGVRGLLNIFGIRLPTTVKHGSFDGDVRPLIEMDDVLTHALVPILDARVVLYQHFLKLDRCVKRAAGHDEVCMRMMTVPDVGPIASLVFKAAVYDSARFKRSRTVGAHFGLTRNGISQVSTTTQVGYPKQATGMSAPHYMLLLQGSPSRFCRGCTQTHRFAPSDLGEWHRIPSGKHGGHGII